MKFKLNPLVVFLHVELTKGYCEKINKTLENWRNASSYNL